MFEGHIEDVCSSLEPLGVNYVEEYEDKNILLAQKEYIVNIADFLKKQVDKYDKIIIYPFSETAWGLGYRDSEGKRSQFLPGEGKIYNTVPGCDRFFVLDKSNLKDFNDQFWLFLGGLLVDYQSFVVKTEDMAEDEMICAFNLLEGGLLPEQIRPSSDLHHTRPPVILTHNLEAYREINAIFREFRESGTIIGFHRVKSQSENVRNFRIACAVNRYIWIQF